MTPFFKKTKKLIVSPKRFFADRKKKIEQATRTKKAPPSNPPKKTAIPNKEVIVYLNDRHADSEKLQKHILKTISKHAPVRKGHYRLDKDEILFEIKGVPLIARTSTPVQNEIFIKGFLLITYEDEAPSEFSAEKKILFQLLHKINVDHMKLLGDFNLLYHYYEDRPERNEKAQIKYALSAGIYTEEITNKAVNLLNEHYATLPTNETILIFKKLYRILGTEQRLELIANKLAAAAHKELPTVDFIMFLAAFFTESGDYKKAIELAEKAKLKDPSAWERNRFLGLSYLLYSSGITTEEWAKRDHELYLILNKNEWEFERYIENNRNNLAIVGNSPVEQSKKQGHVIDGNLKVARFNSAITSFPHSVDYGKKTNILVINPRYYETQRNRKFNLDYIVISDGNLYSTKDLAYKLHDLIQHTDRLCLIPRRIDLSTTQTLAASPSSGLKLLAWLYEINGPIHNDKLYGFSFTDQGHGIATSYASGRRIGLNTIHNWSSEKSYFESIILSELPETA